MKRRHLMTVICLSLALVFLFGFHAAKASAAKYSWCFALEEIEGSMQDAFAKKFKEVAEQKSNGDIQVDIYPYGQLGTSSQITELLQNGAVEFAFQSPGHLGSYIPEVQIFSVHYLFPSNEEVIKKVLKESAALYDTLGHCYEAKDFRLLSIIPEGWQIWTTNKEIRKPDDFEGFKMRVMTSPLLVEAYKAYGASPTPMPYSEIYSALQLKMIDGQVNPYFAIEEMKFYEVTKYMIKADQLMFICTFVSNNEFYKNLPDDIKKIVDEASAAATDFIFSYQDKLNEERKGKILKAKPSMVHYELTPEERAAFQEKAMVVRDKYVEIGGPQAREILDSLVKEIEKVQKEIGS